MTTVHAAPPVFGDQLPCCGILVTQIRAGDWATLNPQHVTCQRRKENSCPETDAST